MGNMGTYGDAADGFSDRGPYSAQNSAPYFSPDSGPDIHAHHGAGRHRPPDQCPNASRDRVADAGAGDAR